MSAVAAYRLEVAPGALTALKWLGLALMVVDHVDAFVYGRELLWAGQLGRLVFPMFAFVVAYNLARPGVVERGVHGRMLRRLAVAGVLALPFHAALRGDLLPLNIMATFAVSVGVVWATQRDRHALAALLFLGAGLLVEYSLPGVALVLVTWSFLRQPSVVGLGLVGVVLGSLYLVNGSHAALWALPVVVLAMQTTITLPRCQWAFYAFYPAHLAVFWLLTS